ncbi:type II secretion system protein [Geodermatophilus sp. SYSU D00684]
MLAYIRNARKNDEGFTLIELLMVIVILGVLAGIVVFAVQGINDDSETAACQADARTVVTAQEAYYAQNDAYAASTTALVTAELLRSAPANISTDATGAVTGDTGTPCASISF